MKKSAFMMVLAVLVTAGSASAGLKVVSTLPDLGTVAEVVGGERVEVEVLCPGAMDPHFLPAKPSLARKLFKADALIYNGLELEVGWLPLLISKARNPSVKPGAPGDIDCSRALSVILDVPEGEVDRGMGDIHPHGNPHYTLDPRRMIEVARYLADRFTRLDPDGAVAYRAGAEAFTARVEDSLARWEGQASEAASLPILLYHRNWNYLADWMDLKVLGEVENRPGISPSPKHVNLLIQQGRHLTGVLVLAAHWDHHDVAEEVTERMGATLVTLPGQTGGMDGADDWFALMDMIGTRLAAGAAEAREGKSQ